MKLFQMVALSVVVLSVGTAGAMALSANQPVSQVAELPERLTFKTGTPAYSMQLEQAALVVDGVAVDSNDPQLAQWPALQNQVNELLSVDRAVETFEGTLKAYAGRNALVFAVGLMNNPSVEYSQSGLTPDSITYSRDSEIDEQLVQAVLNFNLRECRTTQEKQVEQRQRKGLEQAPSRSKVVAVEVCQSVIVSLAFRQIQAPGK